jgi:hypothetical protein
MDGCTWVILLNLHSLFAFAVSRTDFYSLAKQKFFSRSPIYLYCACTISFRAKCFAFRREKALVESGLKWLLLTGEAKFFLAKPNLSLLRMHLIHFARNFCAFRQRKRAWNQALKQALVRFMSVMPLYISKYFLKRTSYYLVLMVIGAFLL